MIIKERDDTMITLSRSKMTKMGYKEWKRYFARNDSKRLVIDFSRESGLTAREKRLIFPSIKAFQKGEGSDGAYLMKCAEKYGEAAAETVRLFIKEENFHSAYLKRYMEHYGVSSAKSPFLDSVFRKLRKLGGFKCEVTVLVTAEIIALTYYSALSECTDSPALKSICGQMLHDELRHIIFQSYNLSRAGSCCLDVPVRYLLMGITSLAVWLAFGNVFRTGGYGFGRFMSENFGYLRQSVKMVNMQNKKGTSKQ